MRMVLSLPAAAKSCWLQARQLTALEASVMVFTKAKSCGLATGGRQERCREPDPKTDPRQIPHMSGLDQADVKKLQNHQNYVGGSQRANPRMEAPNSIGRWKLAHHKL